MGPIPEPSAGARRYWPRAWTGPRVAMIDAYDSFTFNLVQYLLELGAVVDVTAIDGPSAEMVVSSRPTHIVLSPGPGRPEDAGTALVLARGGVGDGDDIPLLGVCLGHQALCLAAGAKVISAPRILHGKVSTITHDGSGPFANLPDRFAATRYHSLAVDPDTLGPTLRPIATAVDDGTLMGVAHAHRPAFGVQFHPESILTEHGHALLSTFLALPVRSARLET